QIDSEAALYMARPRIRRALLPHVLNEASDSSELSTQLTPFASDISHAIADSSVFSSGILSSQLYLVFWGLDLYDVHIPINQYNSEIANQQKLIKLIEKADSTISSNKMFIKERERARNNIDLMEKERTNQIPHCAKITAFLDKMKHNW